MIHSVYLLIHNRIKSLKDKHGYIIRKDIINYLKYPIKIDRHLREIVIRELVELGLLKRINSQKYLFVANGRSEKILDKYEAQMMAKLYRKTWFNDV